MEAAKDRLGIVILGAGLIGAERMKAIRLLRQRGRDVHLLGVYDPFSPATHPLEHELGGRRFSSLDDVSSAAPDLVIVATPHDAAVELSREMLRRGHRVLIEKPLGRDATEAQTITAAAVRPQQLWVGFNYRFFEGVAAALRDVRAGLFGPLICINMVLGHGNNPEMRGSWKLDPIKAGGGCLIDPGIHFLDLARLLAAAPLSVACARSWSGFWKTGIEEESHLLLDAPGFTINMQISIVRWPSTFSIEIHGTEGYGRITGRNRSFGPQRYVRGHRWGWMGRKSQGDSEELVVQSDGEDVFARELEALLFPSAQLPVGPCTAQEGLENMQLLDQCRAAMKMTPYGPGGMPIKDCGAPS